MMKILKYSLLLLSTVTLVACSSLEQLAGKRNDSMPDQSNVGQSTKFNPSDFLNIDTSKLVDSEGQSYELSPLVKEIAGSYSEVIYDSDNYPRYTRQLHVNEDGTYTSVKYNLTDYSGYAYYLDGKHQLQETEQVVEIDNKKYLIYEIDIERGILLEKYGKLYFVDMSSSDVEIFYNEQGELDLVSGLFTEGINNIDYDLTSTEELYQHIVSAGEGFYYDRVFVFDKDRNKYFDENVLKESRVDETLTTPWDKLFTLDKLKSLLESPNTLLQAEGGLKGFKEPIQDGYRDIKISEYTEYSNIYNENGDKAEVLSAIQILEKDPDGAYPTKLIVATPGKISSIEESDGAYIIPSR